MASWRGTKPREWVGKAKSRNMAAVRFSIESLAHAANTPRGKGGLLPLDTAFLRNSFGSAIGQMPSGPSKQSEGNPGEWDGTALSLTLARLQPGDVTFLGWTAEYARPMEARYGFAKTEAMNWKSHVEYGIERAKAGNP